MLTGAVMLTATLSTGPTAAAAQPPVTAAPVTTMVQATVNPLRQLESAAYRAASNAEPTGPAADQIDAEPQVNLPLTQISVLSGRLHAAAPGERAPPRH